MTRIASWDRTAHGEHFHGTATSLWLHGNMTLAVGMLVDTVELRIEGGRCILIRNRVVPAEEFRVAPDTKLPPLPGGKLYALHVFGAAEKG